MLKTKQIKYNQPVFRIIRRPNSAHATHMDLFWELVRTDFKIRYHNSVLGLLWVLLKPLLIFSIIFLAFSFFFKTQDPHYHLNLLLGVLLFSYFSEGTLKGVTSLFDRSNIMLKIKFPSLVAVCASVFHSLLNFLFGFVIFLIFWAISDIHTSFLSFFVMGGFVMLLTFFILGLSLFLSILFIRLRDLVSIWEVLLQLLFYATPVIYPLTFVPSSFTRYVLLNPLAVVIVESRSALIAPMPLHAESILIVSSVTFFLLLGGYFFFQAHMRRIMEYF